jgi:hypothetical protein
VAKQTVRCVKKTGWREENVSEDQCKGVGHRPGDLVMCTGECNPAQWQYTEWSRVSKPSQQKSGSSGNAITVQ